MNKHGSIRVFFSILVVGFFVTACQTTQEALLDTEQSQLKTRIMQSRYFDTTNKEKTLRTIIATLQDLHFVVDKADLVLGTVTGTKLDHYRLRMTVSVRPRGKTQLIVRANAQFNVTPVVDPKHYQSFFVALEKAMFLAAHNVE